MAAQYDLSIKAGEPFNETTNDYFEYQDDEGTPISLSGYTAKMDIRRDVANQDYVLRLTTANGGIVLNSQPGYVYVRLTAEQTAALQTANFITGVYDLFVYAPNGTADKIMYGAVNVQFAVTRN